MCPEHDLDSHDDYHYHYHDHDHEHEHEHDRYHYHYHYHHHHHHDIGYTRVDDDDIGYVETTV